jgi:hypothetical protein
VDEPDVSQPADLAAELEPEPVVMTSVEKTIAALAHIDELQPDDPQAQAIVLTMTIARPRIAAMLQALDPAELDDLLTKAAAWALGLRSDDVEPLTIAPGP